MNMPTLVVDQTSFSELGYSAPVICDNSNETMGTVAIREGRRQERETYILTEENILVLFAVVTLVLRTWPDSSLSLVLYDSNSLTWAYSRHLESTSETRAL
jgi:hypothetical protein